MERGKGKPESQKEANRAHARLRAPSERANAQLKTWKILRRSILNRSATMHSRQIAKMLDISRDRVCYVFRSIKTGKSRRPDADQAAFLAPSE